MNAAVRAVVRRAIYQGLNVLGYHSGYQGLLENDFQDMDLSSVGGIIDRGGTVLGTARCEAFKTPEGQQKALANLKKQGVEGLVVIGGDGSYRGAEALAGLGLPTIGIPGTIDNDIGGTDFCIGFDTAVNTAVDAISKLRDTASAHERIFVVEVMGRSSGWIALYAGLAGGADFIIVPEAPPWDVDMLCDAIKQGFNRGKLHSIIVVAEGAASAQEVTMKLLPKVQTEVKMSVLGHVQRGGTPTAADRVLASRLGAAAVERLLEGGTSEAIGIQGTEIAAVPLKETYSVKKKLDRRLFELASVLAR